MTKDSINLDSGVKPQNDTTSLKLRGAGTTSLKLRGAGTTSLKLRGAGTTVLCFLFLGTIVIPAKAGIGAIQCPRRGPRCNIVLR